jgi:hypothetical protein
LQVEAASDPALGAPVAPIKKNLEGCRCIRCSLGRSHCSHKKKNLEALCAPIASIKKQKLKKTLKLDAALEVALGAPIAPTPLIPVLLLCVREVCK